MKHHITIKLLLGYLLFGLGAIVAVAVLSFTLTSRYLTERYARNLYDEACYLASCCRSYSGGDEFDSSGIDSSSGLLSSLGSCRILFVQKSGRILYDSSASLKETLLENFDPAASGSELYEAGTYYGCFPERMLSVTVPVTGNLQTYGYVVLLTTMQEVLSGRDTLVNLCFLCAGAVYFLSFSILLLHILLVTKPLKVITRATREYADGNLSYHPDLSSEDEIGELAGTLNYMAYEISETEESQRRFVSNISHDFRSPLTSIKGYLEAMLDGTIPPELYEKYMRIVVTETERLTKLTQSTLALQSLESRGTLLDLESFDINAVIKDTAQSFEGICGKKGITFDLTFSDTAMPVTADKGKIQQVLYNLIDNAIKFSSPSSVIWIEVYDRYDKVFVSVKDSGCGIPRDSQKKIWTRFYKADNSRGRDRTGTGLGLAIVKDIITAHNQNIDVISTEGIGTEFIFTLNRTPAPEEEEEETAGRRKKKTEAGASGEKAEQ